MTILSQLSSMGTTYTVRKNYLSQSPQMVYVRPQRSIGGLTADVVIEETHSDELEITEHPVEQGADITDHAYNKASTVTIRGGVSDSGGTGTGDRRSVEFYEQLLALQSKREPFDLVTGKRSYKNMLIAKLSAVTDEKSEHSLLFTAELREVMLAAVQTVSVPRSRHKYGNKTGGVDQKGQVQLQPVKRSTALELKGGSGYRRTS